MSGKYLRNCFRVAGNYYMCENVGVGVNMGKLICVKGKLKGINWILTLPLHSFHLYLFDV